MLKGIIFALTACFIWGFIFIIPGYISDFDSFEIALGRHFVYGCLSTLLFLTAWNKKAAYPQAIWRKAFLFSLITNILYYCCVVIGVRHSSPAITALILGISPISIAFYGNYKERTGDFAKLIVPTLLILVGLVFVNLPVLEENFTSRHWLGILAAFISLFAWSWYVVANAIFLKANPQLTSEEWSTLLGTTTLIWVLFFGFFYESWLGTSNLTRFSTLSNELLSFVSGCLVLGILCSWLGAYLWNKASKILPLSLAGQLTVFETIFGILFVYVIKWQFPLYTEIIGISVILSAIFYSLKRLPTEESCIVSNN